MYSMMMIIAKKKSKKLQDNQEFSSVNIANELTHIQRTHEGTLWRKQKTRHLDKGKYKVRGSSWTVKSGADKQRQL